MRASLSADEVALLDEAHPYTMTSPERLLANIDAAGYVVKRGIPGAIVECGVWRGGSSLVMIRTLQRLGVSNRDVYLYDTFTGMTEPTAADTSQYEEPALKVWQETSPGETPWEDAFGPESFSVESVRRVINGTGYPPDRLHLVPGPVEETIPGSIPEQIAVLRLDTDWYESTKHELRHLYPRLSPGGVLIIDDYGHWEGARRAVDEFLEGLAVPLLLNRIDYTGRVAVKP
jgi:hypothetical protein